MFKVREKGKQFLSNCPSGLVCVKTVIAYGLLSTIQGSGEQ